VAYPPREVVFAAQVSQKITDKLSRSSNDKNVTHGSRDVVISRFGAARRKKLRKSYSEIGYNIFLRHLRPLAAKADPQ
jgi:hypothetical protein